MKKFLFTLLLIPGLSNARSLSPKQAPIIYSKKLELVELSPQCDISEGMTCMAINSIFKAEATVGCGDQVVYKDYSTLREGQKTIIYATLIMKKGPLTNFTNCRSPEVVTLEGLAPDRVNRIILKNVPVTNF